MLTKYADTLKRRGLDTCSSQILADVLESFPKAISVKQLAHNTGISEKYIKLDEFITDFIGFEKIIEKYL